MLGLSRWGDKRAPLFQLPRRALIGFANTNYQRSRNQLSETLDTSNQAAAAITVRDASTISGNNNLHFNQADLWCCNFIKKPRGREINGNFANSKCPLRPPAKTNGAGPSLRLWLQPNLMAEPYQDSWLEVGQTKHRPSWPSFIMLPKVNGIG